MTALFFTQVLRSYFDVVFGPVDTADGHAQAAQAALVHVTGNGAAHTQRAQQGKPAWLREIETTQEKPTVCTWKDSWKGIRCAHKLCSPHSTQRGWSGNLKAGICLVGWSQPWSQIWPGEWQGFVFEHQKLWTEARDEGLNLTRWWRWKTAKLAKELSWIPD